MIGIVVLGSGSATVRNRLLSGETMYARRLLDDRVEPDRLVGLPLWAWHGDADPAVPVERSRQMVAAIKKAGGSPKYTELPGVGHDSWTKAYTDPQGAIPWMFEQRRGASGK